MKESGIYSLTCLANYKVYIGSSIDIKNRWKRHLKSLRSGIHHCAYLQRTWNKYGEIFFRFSILENVAKVLLLNREQFWINRNLEHLFNSCKIAGSPLGTKHTELTKEKLRNKPKQIKSPLSISTKHKISISNAKLKYQIIYPDNSTQIITNLTKFCRQMNLQRSNMVAILKGRRKSHQGFSCSYFPT